MAIVMQMNWPEVSKEQYEMVRRDVNWEGDVPAGAKFHLTWFDDGGFHVIDVWSSREMFERFGEDRLAKGTAKVGLKTQPEVRISEAHSMFAPDPTL